MTDSRRFLPIDVSLVLLILAVAAGARGWYLTALADGGDSAGSIRVQDLPGAEHVAPAYPWLLTMSRLAPSPDRTVRWAQAALGALTAALYFLFARRAFDNRLVAALAGLFCALHPFWVVSVAELEDGVLAAFLLGLAVWLGARGGESGGALTSLLYGLTLAGLALVRAALLPFAFVAELWFLWRCRSLPRGWLYALLAFLGFANALVPWGVHSYRTSGQPVPVVDSAWRHLWVGNHLGATGGPQPVPEAPPQDQLASAVLTEVRDHPAATLNRRLWAGASFVFGEDWLLYRRAWQPADLDWPYALALLGALLGMLLLAFFGWRWTHAWQHESMPAALAVAWVPLPYLLSHAEALSGPRLPLDGVLLCCAAFALVWLLPRAGAQLRQGTTPEEDAVPG